MFFPLFLVTIVITRVFVYLKPIPSPTIRGFRTHHYMYGIAIAIIGAFAHNIILYAIGLGLFIDELGYLLINGKTHEDNYSKPSLILLAIFVILVFLFREQILFWS